MDNPPPPSISSFIIRFVVHDQPDTVGSVPATSHNNFYGAIRHIQTDQEINFSHWDEVVKFIERFVHLDTDSSPTK